MVRLAAAIHNYRFLSDTDRSRPMDMNPTNAKLSLQRALCFKNFVPKPETEVNEFLKSFFDSILDYRKKSEWKIVPVENTRDFLQFPYVIHTGTADYANELSYFSLSQFQSKNVMSFLSTKEYQKHNFHAAILNPGHLKNIILASPPLSGQYDGLEVLRFRTPYMYNQTGFNSESYKGFLIYNRVERFDQNDILNMTLQGAYLEDTHEPNWFFKNCFKMYFCTCAAGSRSKGACVHVVSVVLGMAASNAQRSIWEIIPSPSLDAETFPDTHISPESALQNRPSSSHVSFADEQPSAKRTRH